ncbi:SGNH/GDSL hydrolase family protein [Seonamhaeicola sp.]|uniref:SGNH/GDSL hydrolase family protein n=1 Tax=Seonamhaeicola sp. TaxID=1912245 RepID=UPI0026349EA3|nr:SGNH/GDSL hydrolase family protein [Seonamhaeicola sp.]
MKLKIRSFCVAITYFVLVSCASDQQPDASSPDDDNSIPEEASGPPSDIKILSLGDSYTIGQSVCETCRFPEQLKDSLQRIASIKEVDLKVIATTGWTTTSLLNAINNENLDEDYDLSTLLIGVNNQFQHKPFTLFEEEFPKLVSEAIKYSKGKKENLIVVSIPDYAFTPFGGGESSISTDLDKYNAFIENYCLQYSITYIYITDITRKGFENPDLVASDGLHPSTLAYSEFVSRMLPEALKKIGYVTD